MGQPILFTSAAESQLSFKNINGHSLSAQAAGIVDFRKRFADHLFDPRIRLNFGHGEGKTRDQVWK